MRNHLEQVIEVAFGAECDETPVAGVAENLLDAAGEVSTLPMLACTVCRGRCCLGGTAQAYISAEDVRRYVKAKPATTREEILEAYLNCLADVSYENSCIFHQEQGCGLPRHLRSATCNEFECLDLKALHNCCRDQTVRS